MLIVVRQVPLIRMSDFSTSDFKSLSAVQKEFLVR